MTFQEFIATRRAVACVETACGFDADMPNQPGYVYADGLLYIEAKGCDDADGYRLLLERSEFDDKGADGLRRLENELYRYAIDAGFISA